MKTKLTPEIQEKIIKNVKKGFYVKESVATVGICKKTYYNWLQRGAKALWPEENGEKVPKSEKIFLHSVQQANAIGELEIFSEIRSQVKRDWHAGMEILARKYPKRWGKKDKLTVKTPKAALKTKHDIEAERAIEEFRREEKKLTSEQRKQLVAFTIKAEKEFKESNANNGDSKNG